MVVLVYFHCAGQEYGRYFKAVVLQQCLASVEDDSFDRGPRLRVTVGDIGHLLVVIEQKFFLGSNQKITNLLSSEDGVQLSMWQDNQKI